jgi:energy-coupling factor transporter ATP-binding protein EcfA2
MFHYVMSGLRVESDFAMPGLIETDSAAAAPDILLCRGEVPTELANSTISGPNWQMAAGQFLLRIPGIVRMMLDAGTMITWQCEDLTSPEDAAIFVTGSGFGLLMHQHGRSILHASAVEVSGKAVLFCGPSGAGKSTLAAALAAKGFGHVADDQCVLSGLSEGAALVHPDGRAHKLWEHAIDQLDLADRSGPAIRSQVRKFYVQPGRASIAPIPLAAIYVLTEARAPDLAMGARVAITPLNLADAALVVRANAYRPAMVERLGQGGLYLDTAAAAMHAGGVFRLTRPMVFADMDAVITALGAHWQYTGLMERVA